MFNRFVNRWDGQGGFKDVLLIAFPLMLSAGVHTLQMFIDRVFLSWYDLDMMPAAMQAGMTSFTFTALFLGIATYVSTFVAQYNGAQRQNRVGPAVWQGIYFSIISGIICLSLIFLAEPLFNWMGHDASIRVHELAYFRIICLGIGPLLLASTLSCFYTGRGKTWTVLFVTTVGTIVNIVLDYLMIFGKFGFPEMGIRGAATATVIAGLCSLVIYIILFLQPKYEKKYASLSGFKPDFALFWRLMRFGFPAGLQFMFDMMAFSLFVAFAGRIGKIAHTATTMTFSINLFAFLPMIGMGMAVSVIVSNALGKNKPEIAHRCTWSAFYMCFAYMTAIAMGYFLVPEFFIWPFKANANPADFDAVMAVAKNLLIFVAFYSIFDTGNIIFAAALKGAGDTKFVMFLSISAHWLLLVLPAYFIVKYNFGLYWVWATGTLFICVLAVVFFIRFLGGKWKNMRVIEQYPVAIPSKLPSVPTMETDIS